MPLTPAQRQQNYRRKLKRENPEKYAELSKRNLERSKEYYRRKVKNYTQKQREELRRKWREEKLKKGKNIHAPIGRRKIYTSVADFKERHVEIEDEVEIKEEVIEINDDNIDNTYVMLAEDFVAHIDVDDSTDPIKTEGLQEVVLRGRLRNSQNQTNKKQILLKDFETDDTEICNKTPKGIPEDPDLLFLYSLLPDIKEMSKDQKRRFKIKVLQVTNDILLEK